MDQNFSLMAQSRANYYTAGSPVQFVRVELLKGDTTGEVAVCLTFKNVGTEPLTGLVVHFKCKDAAGQVLCEDDFYYEQLNAQPGAVFGSDDAVYVSDTPVSSVEVEQDRAFLNGRGVDLRNYKRVRLNMPRVLPGSIAKTLQQRTGNVQLTCVPQDTEYGWFCACGAFHPNEENTTVCSECGGDRAGIKATLTAILEEARQAAERQQQEVNAVASSVAPAPAPAPQPQAQPAPAASDPRAMANAVQAAITGQQDIPPQSAYEPEQATAAFVYMQIVYTTSNFKGGIYRAVLAILLGLALLIWPADALKYVVMLIGIVFLAIGIIAFIISSRNREEHQRSFAPLSGIGSVILGLLLVCLPSTFATVFMFLLGFILVVAAVGQFVTLAAARQFGRIAPVSFLFPVLILIVGIVILFDPFSSAESVFILFGITAVFYGVTDLLNQYSIRKMRKASEEKEKIVKMGGDSDIEDAEFEEVEEGK